MARTAIPTMVTGQLMTAAFMNAYLRDNEAAHWSVIQENNERVLVIPIFSDTTRISSGNGKREFTFPFDCVVEDFDIACYVPPTEEQIEVQMYRLDDTVDILTTPGTIDTGEYSSYTAATPAVIDTNHDNFLAGDRVQFDVDQDGGDALDTTAYGLEVHLKVRRE